MSDKLITARSLESLRKEAKRWLKALRDDVADAKARLEHALHTIPSKPTLRDVQHALAIEYGFPGWAELKNDVGTPRDYATSPVSVVDWFLDNACPDHHVRSGPAHVRAKATAQRILARYPEIASHDLYTRIVCGDLSGVEQLLRDEPARANRRNGEASARRSAAAGDDWLLDLGPKGWEPILYLCFTRLDAATVNANAERVLRLLLGSGADPNAFFMAGSSRYTPLTGLIGGGEENRPPHPQRDTLVPIVLEAGANPYDVQVFYNIHFKGDVLWYLQLVYDHAARTGRLEDFENPDWPMIDMGGYGSGARYLLATAIRHDNVELAEWLLGHGANPNASPPADKRGRTKQGTLLELAEDRGAIDIARLLVQHGASQRSTVTKPSARLLGAAMRGDLAEARAIVAEHPQLRTDPQPMFSASELDRPDALDVLLEAGIPIEISDEHNQRALHAGAYAGSLGAVQFLVSRGAEIDPMHTSWGNTPLGAAAFARHDDVVRFLAPLSRDIWELVWYGDMNRVRELIAEDPARARATGGGHTLLMWLPVADERRAIAIAELLLANGADPTPRNNDGHTAADRAARMGMFELADLLRRAERRARRHTLAEYEEMAAALLEAFNTGTDEAMEKLYQVAGYRRSWSAMRTYALLDLGRPAPIDGETVSITRDEARKLVARGHDFAGWPELLSFIESLSSASSTILRRPVRVFTGSGSSRTTLGKTRTVDHLMSLLRTDGVIGLDAEDAMTDDLLNQVGEISTLQSLELGGSRKLTDSGLSALARMPNLRHLDLRGTGITDRGLAVLAELPLLESITLAQTSVTDAGMEHLKAHEHLERVDLRWTATGDSALRVLAGKPRLAQLFTGNEVSDAGLGALQDYPQFTSWQGGEVRMALLSYEAAPTLLHLRGRITDAGLSGLIGLDGLFGLNLDASELGLSHRAIAPLQSLPQLGWLAVDATDEWMPHIARLSKLRFLGCQDTTAGDDGFSELAASTTLEYIWGRRCHNLRDRGFRALAGIPTLRSFALSCLNVSDEALATLPSFPSLRELMPMDVPDEGYRHIAKCTDLDSLVLMYCRDTSDRATDHITALPRLKQYFNSYSHITDASCRMLSTMDSLERVTISACPGVTDAGAVLLARLPNLREVDVTGQNVTSAIASAFPPHVKVKT